jgi:YegS/Rv2252/BmrU family lipid kinase
MENKDKTLLILNPVAGKGKGKKNFNIIHNLLKEKFRNIEIIISEYRGHISKISGNAIKDGFKRILTIGGDGTPYEVINGIKTKEELKNIEIGMIPAGTGNSFLRDFVDINYKKIIDRIKSGKTRYVDVIEIEYGKEKKRKYYLNILGVGLIADILKLTNEKLKFMGELGYSVSVLTHIFKGLKNKIKMRYDKESIELKNSAMVISNSKYTGGKMKISPLSDTQDGKVDIVIFDEVSRIDIIKIFAGVFKGSHLNHKKVKHIRASEIEIEATPQLLLMADGELLNQTPLKLTVLPKALKILI